MKFTKMHGLGNDFILINCIDQSVSRPGVLARELCDRHLAVGGDGLLLVYASTCADFRLRYFNRDGSEGEMCGNGLRCAAKYVYEKGLSNEGELCIETEVGQLNVFLDVQDGEVCSVTEELGAPRLRRREIPVAVGNPDSFMINESVEFANGMMTQLTAVKIGPPHVVGFVDDLEVVNVCELGSSIRLLKDTFPAGVNVNFAQVFGENKLKIRTYERGVEDETLACGTGAAAAAVAASLLGKTNERGSIIVVCRGGEVSIRLEHNAERITNVFLTGPAKMVFEGCIASTTTSSKTECAIASLLDQNQGADAPKGVIAEHIRGVRSVDMVAKSEKGGM